MADPVKLHPLLEELMIGLERQYPYGVNVSRRDRLNPKIVAFFLGDDCPFIMVPTGPGTKQVFYAFRTDEDSCKLTNMTDQDYAQAEEAYRAHLIRLMAKTFNVDKSLVSV